MHLGLSRLAGGVTQGILLLLFSWVIRDVAAQMSAADLPKCTTVQNRCYNQRGCKAALFNYITYCSQSLRLPDVRTRWADEESSTSCNVQCVEALVALLSTSDGLGEGFMQCDCENEPICVQQRDSMLRCQDQILTLMQDVNDQYTQVSCLLAELVCMADTSCGTAYEFHGRHCELMFLGETCTHRCNNSLSILYHQTSAHKLRSCSCDSYPGEGGRGQRQCQHAKDNMQSLCHWQLDTHSSTPALATTPPSSVDENTDYVYSTTRTQTTTTQPSVGCEDSWGDPCTGSATVAKAKPFLYLSLCLIIIAKSLYHS